MSLFGDEDAPSTRQTKGTLFDDEQPTPAKNASSTMFGDPSADETESSPWGFTPKKASNPGGVVKTLLAGADVPEVYVDTFDALQVGGTVPSQECQRLLAGCGIGERERRRIWEVVAGRGEQGGAVGRGEFNVLLALVGLAQEGEEELGLDAVDERRRRLPVPKLPAAPKPAAPAASENAHPQALVGAPATPERTLGRPGKSSYGGSLDTDPWASPEMHKGHGHANGNGGTQRTTSTFTTNSMAPTESTSGGYSNGPAAGGSSSGEPGSWGGSTFGAGNTAGFGGAGAAGEGFGDDGQETTVPRPQAQTRTPTNKGVEEVVTVNVLEEKEGMFLFQHRNYEVASVRRSSKVIRRYSDFVWLLDCLHKRYPFRQLPLLPPKRVAINGNHIAADSLFIEKRRRGLARFANALVRHPVLREEQLVVMFLTVPTELAVWRKQATISVQEEFAGKRLPPNLEDSLPQDLPTIFETVRSGVRRSADLYINLCNIIERLCKRKEAIAGEYGRLSLNLTSITEASSDTYAIDANDVPLLNEGINGTAKHVSTSQALLDDEARAWDQGWLEDAKAMRDSLVSMRDVFDRRDRLSKDNIPSLERRIQQNEAKLAGIKNKGDAAKPGEAEKVENAIVNDKQSIVDQHARGVFIKECVRDEILNFQATQFRVTRLHQEWAQERVKYAELQTHNFRTMVDAVEIMPLE